MGGRRPTPPDPVTLLSQLLDSGYTDATSQVIRSIMRDSDSGALGKRLDQLDQHAQELDAKGESLSEDDPVLRAVLADFGDALKKDALLIDAAAPDVQQIGIDGAGYFIRQTSLPGFSDQQLQHIGIGWNVPDAESVNALVNFTGLDAWKAQLEQYQTGISDQARQTAIRGIVSGQGPLAIARDLRAITENIPAYQANNLMRTLQLESFRTGAAIHQQANSDILDTSIRLCALDDRTCLACIALSGTEVPLGVPIDEHEQGRCFVIAKPKGSFGDAIMQQYRDGYPVLMQNGEDWFNSLPEDQQKAIAGPAAFEALKNGDVKLQDFVQQYENPVFGSMVRQGSLSFAQNNPGTTIQTVEGFLRADKGKPGNTEDSLNAFLKRSDGPLAIQLRDPEMALLELDWNTDQYTVNTANVKDAAKQFVVESRDIQYGKDYILSLVQEQAAENGMTIDLQTAATLYNQQYQYQAQAIQTAADIGDVKLTQAQLERLANAAAGNYLDMVYTTQSSLAGSLENSTKRKVSYGGNSYATDAARRAAREEFLDRMGRLG